LVPNGSIHYIRQEIENLEAMIFGQN